MCQNVEAVKYVLKTAIPLSLGSILLYGEWQVLTIFASFMGPAEVVAWSTMGIVWSVFEAATQGIGDAGEVRMGFHLATGNLELAKQAAHKCVCMSVVYSLIITSMFLVMRGYVPSFFASDQTLMLPMCQIIPFIGIGNITMTFGSASWMLISGQGRCHLATFIQFCTSWGLTIPLAAIFTFYLNFNLEGITSAVVIGYALAGKSYISVLYCIMLTHAFCHFRFYFGWYSHVL